MRRGVSAHERVEGGRADVTKTGLGLRWASVRWMGGVCGDGGYARIHFEDAFTQSRGKTFVEFAFTR